MKTLTGIIALGVAALMAVSCGPEEVVEHHYYGSGNAGNVSLPNGGTTNSFENVFCESIIAYYKGCGVTEPSPLLDLQGCKNAYWDSINGLEERGCFGGCIEDYHAVLVERANCRSQSCDTMSTPKHCDQLGVAEFNAKWGKDLFP